MTQTILMPFTERDQIQHTNPRISYKVMLPYGLLMPQSLPLMKHGMPCWHGILFPIHAAANAVDRCI